MTRFFNSLTNHPNRGFTYGLLISFFLGALCYISFSIMFSWQLGFAQNNFYGRQLAGQIFGIQETMTMISLQIVLLTSVVALVLSPLGLWVLKKRHVVIRS